jgi:hypothetical protein
MNERLRKGVDHVHEDPYTFELIREALRRATEEGERRYRTALNASGLEDQELTEEHQVDLKQRDGWHAALEFTAWLFQIEEIYDQPDERS